MSPPSDEPTEGSAPPERPRKVTWALLSLIRWPGAVTAVGNAGAAFLVTHQPDSPGGGAAVLGVGLGAALVYAGGVTLNDVADAHRDRELHPDRPLPSAAVSRRTAAVFGALLCLVGIAVSTLLAGPATGVLTAAAAAFAVVYDFVAKRWSVPGAVFMGLARAANAAAGVLAAEPATGWESLALPQLYVCAIFAYTMVLTLVSTLEGRRPSLTLASGCATVIVLVAALPWPLWSGAFRLAPALALLPLAASLTNGAREATVLPGPGLGAVVRRGVFGFLLVDAAWLFGVQKHDYGFWLLLLYVLLRLVLARARS